MQELGVAQKRKMTDEKQSGETVTLDDSTEAEAERKTDEDRPEGVDNE